MTLGTILKTVLGPSDVSYYNQSPGGKLFSERNGGEYYHHMGHHHSSSKNGKGDKKHAILSALSLLAFLFFLNILANCIREQTITTTPIVMLSQGKMQVTTEEYKRGEKRFRRSANEESKESFTEAVDLEQSQEEASSGRKSRTLLQVIQRTGNNRQKKFIRHLRNSSNWTNELTQMSDRDLEDQKMKTMNFPLFWKNSRLSDSTNAQNGNATNLDAGILPTLRRLKKRDRLTTTTTAPETTIVTQFNSNGEEQKAAVEAGGSQKTSDNGSDGSKKIVKEGSYQVSWFRGGHNEDWQNKSHAATTKASVTTTSPHFSTKSSFVEPHIVTASPWKQSEFFNDHNKSKPLESATARSQMYGLNLDTYQTYPMPYYSNQRSGSVLSEDNLTYNADTPTVVSETKVPPSDYYSITSETPYYSKSGHPSQFYYNRFRYRNKAPNHKGYIHRRNEYPDRYRYSPYRKVGKFNRRHSAYYPVVLAAARYPDDDGFDFVKFAWTMVTTLAKPLTKLVHGFEKDDGPDEYQCYDLMICEAQRASKYMGPTAETLASTLGTMLTWAVTDETRQLIVDAIKSGKENTCQQQIKDCEDRSGGKSAMTVIAQFLEMKLS